MIDDAWQGTPGTTMAAEDDQGQDQPATTTAAADNDDGDQDQDQEGMTTRTDGRDHRTRTRTWHENPTMMPDTMTVRTRKMTVGGAIGIVFKGKSVSRQWAIVARVLSSSFGRSLVMLRIILVC